MEAQQYRANEKDEDELVLEDDKIGLKTKLEDDPNAPKEDKSASNYQTKVTDPTGASKLLNFVFKYLSIIHKYALYFIFNSGFILFHK